MPAHRRHRRRRRRDGGGCGRPAASADLAAARPLALRPGAPAGAHGAPGRRSRAPGGRCATTRSASGTTPARTTSSSSPAGIAFNILLAVVPFVLLLAHRPRVPAQPVGRERRRRRSPRSSTGCCPAASAGARRPAPRRHRRRDPRRAARVGVLQRDHASSGSRRGCSGRCAACSPTCSTSSRSAASSPGKIFDIKITVVVDAAARGVHGAQRVPRDRDDARRRRCCSGVGVRERRDGRRASTGSAALIAFAFIATMFFALYKFLPIRRVRWQTALVAAMFASALLELAKVRFAYYIARFNPGSLYTGTLAARRDRRVLGLLRGAHLHPRRRGRRRCTSCGAFGGCSARRWRTERPRRVAARLGWRMSFGAADGCACGEPDRVWPEGCPWACTHPHTPGGIRAQDRHRRHRTRRHARRLQEDRRRASSRSRRPTSARRPTRSTRRRSNVGTKIDTINTPTVGTTKDTLIVDRPTAGTKKTEVKVPDGRREAPERRHEAPDRSGARVRRRGRLPDGLPAPLCFCA